MTGDSAVKRGTYSTKLRSRQDNGCPSLAHSHTVSTQLYQTPLSLLPPLLCSALSLSFSLTSVFLLLITEEWGIMKPQLTRVVLGARFQRGGSASLSPAAAFSSRPSRPRRNDGARTPRGSRQRASFIAARAAFQGSAELSRNAASQQWMHLLGPLYRIATKNTHFLFVISDILNVRR